MGRKTSEIVADTVEIAKLTAADMAKMSGIHQATLSKYVNDKLEPDPHWTHHFVVQLANLYDKRLDRLIELIEEAADLWYKTPESLELQRMIEADMKARGKKGSAKPMSVQASRLRKKSKARKRGKP